MRGAGWGSKAGNDQAFDVRHQAQERAMMVVLDLLQGEGEMVPQAFEGGGILGINLHGFNEWGGGW